ncbi:hypothetical protein F350042L8_03170 [Fusobacterium ulcerans]
MIIGEFWNEMDKQNWNELSKYFLEGAEINSFRLKPIFRVLYIIKGEFKLMNFSFYYFIKII